MKTLLVYLMLCFTSLFYAQTIPMYVGTYTDNDSEGIYYYNFNTKTGELSGKKLATTLKNPSFLTFSSNKKRLYAVSEASENSLVAAYNVGENGLLTLMDKVSSNGNGPCHLQLNKANNKLAVSNYGGGTISINSVSKNGSINGNAQVFNHNTTSKTSHVHSSKFYKNNLFVADLGNDFLAQYVFNGKKYTLKENHIMANGAGPRHFEISKKGSFIFVINELNSTISVLKKNKESYINIQNISTLNTNYTGENACADIHLSKNEKFLYASNRGENSIAIFSIDKKSGELKKIQSVNVEGNWPRNFAISPNGKFLLVANQISKNISVFRVHKSTGALTFINSVNTPTPVCLLF